MNSLCVQPLYSVQQLRMVNIFQIRQHITYHYHGLLLQLISERKRLVHLDFVVVGDFTIFHRQRHEDFAEPRHNRCQQSVLVFNHNEKACIVAELFDAPSQGGLCVYRQMIRINQHNDFEPNAAIEMNIRLRKELEFFPDKFDPFAVSTIDKHDVVLDVLFVVVVDFSDEVLNDGFLPRSSLTVKNNMRDSIGAMKRIEFV